VCYANVFEELSDELDGGYGFGDFSVSAMDACEVSEATVTAFEDYGATDGGFDGD